MTRSHGKNVKGRKKRLHVVPNTKEVDGAIQSQPRGFCPSRIVQRSRSDKVTVKIGQLIAEDRSRSQQCERILFLRKTPDGDKCWSRRRNAESRASLATGPGTATNGRFIDAVIEHF